MLTLALLRHAKSNWDDADLDDFERPLAKRGIAAAPRMGRYIAQHKLAPDLVLCSTAVRTRATLALVLPELKHTPKIQYEDGLYLAPPDTILDLVSKAPKDASRLLVIAHNPGLHALALALTGGGDRALIGKLASGFPTAALAVFEIDAKSWREILPGRAKLTHFMIPRDLRE